MPAAVCVNSANRGCSPVHTWTHVGTGQCPRCFCLRFSFRCSSRAAWGSGRFCPSGMHSRRSSSPAREFERAQIDPDASEAPSQLHDLWESRPLQASYPCCGCCCLRCCLRSHWQRRCRRCPPYSSVPGWVAAFQPACKVSSGPAPSFYKRFGENVLLIRRI